jgi:hypothetical protein
MCIVHIFYKTTYKVIPLSKFIFGIRKNYAQGEREKERKIFHPYEKKLGQKRQ